jgi:hypothetical protein
VEVATSNQERWSVLSRVLAAGVGGYALVTLLHLALPVLLSFPAYQSLLFAMQTGFIVYTLVIIWAFAAKTATRAWVGLLYVALPLLVIDLWYLQQGGKL